jgi:hypothetical protein
LRASSALDIALVIAALAIARTMGDYYVNRAFFTRWS